MISTLATNFGPMDAVRYFVWWERYDFSLRYDFDFAYGKGLRFNKATHDVIENRALRPTDMTVMT
jgi:hypothetical protein